MEPYGQYCPVARAAEVFADRWTLLIVRELLAGAHRFNELDRGLPGVSRPLLAGRLRRLERASVVERRGAGGGPPGYYLTPAGQELRAVIDSIGAWGARWTFGDPRPGELDPVLLLWRMRRRPDRAALPPGRTVVRFEFRGGRRPRILWLVLDRADVSLCLVDPGFDPGLVVTADLRAFSKMWLGRMTLGEATRDGLVQLDRVPDLVRAFPRWLQLGSFAGAVCAAMRGESRAARGRST